MRIESKKEKTLTKEKSHLPIVSISLSASFHFVIAVVLRARFSPFEKRPQPMPTLSAVRLECSACDTQLGDIDRRQRGYWIIYRICFNCDGS